MQARLEADEGTRRILQEASGRGTALLRLDFSLLSLDLE